MAMAAELSVRLGLIPAAQATRIARIIAAAGLPLRAPSLGVGRYVELMGMDKKAAAGRIRFIVLAGPGRAAVREADAEVVGATIEAFGG